MKEKILISSLAETTVWHIHGIQVGTKMFFSIRNNMAQTWLFGYLYFSSAFLFFMNISISKCKDLDSKWSTRNVYHSQCPTLCKAVIYSLTGEAITRGGKGKSRWRQSYSWRRVKRSKKTFTRRHESVLFARRANFVLSKLPSLTGSDEGVGLMAIFTQ